MALEKKTGYRVILLVCRVWSACDLKSLLYQRNVFLVFMKEYNESTMMNTNYSTFRMPCPSTICFMDPDLTSHSPSPNLSPP